MIVATCVSDRSEPGFRDYLKGSCRYHGLPLEVLEHDGPWESHRLKDRHLRDLVTSLEPEEIVLFTDGYDAVLLSPEEEILEQYHTFDRPLVFAAERSAWPYRTLADRYPPSTGRFRYLNSGGFIGTAGRIADLLARYPDPPSHATPLDRLDWWLRERFGGVVKNPDVLYRWSNQYYWAQIFLRHPEVIALDHGARMFLTLGPDTQGGPADPDQIGREHDRPEIVEREARRLSRECRIVDERLFYCPTGTMPSHLHFNSIVAQRIADSGMFDELMPWLRSRRYEE